MSERAWPRRSDSRPGAPTTALTLGCLSLGLALISMGAVFSGGFYVWMPASLAVGGVTQLFALRVPRPRPRKATIASVLGWTAIFLMVLFWGLIPTALGL